MSYILYSHPNQYLYIEGTKIMEQHVLPDFGGRRTGGDRRVLFTKMPFESERRSGEDRRHGIERRLEARFMTGAIKDLNTIKFEKPSTLGKLLKVKKNKV